MVDHFEDVTEVWIHNRKYSVRGNDPEYVRTLARYLDEKMTEVADCTPTVDSLKVAVLTALNIVDDLFALRDSLEQLERDLHEKSDRLIGQIETVLE